MNSALLASADASSYNNAMIKWKDKTDKNCREGIGEVTGIKYLAQRAVRGESTDIGKFYLTFSHKDIGTAERRCEALEALIARVRNKESINQWDNAYTCDVCDKTFNSGRKLNGMRHYCGQRCRQAAYRMNKT